MEFILAFLVGPCGVFTKAEFDAAKTFWESRGFRVQNTLEPRKCDNDYLNGSDEERFADLCHRPTSEEADVVVAMRGGSGARRLWSKTLPPLGKNPPMLMGYSDVSILHLQRFYQQGLVGIHGPVFKDLSKQSDDVIAATINLIKNRQTEIEYPPMKALSRVETSVSGELIVMNLASLTSLVGAIKPDFFSGKILALEDVNEPAYRLDRMLVQMAEAGILSGLKGIILGQFHEDPAEHHNLVHQAILPTLQEKAPAIPVFEGPFFGHFTPNYPLLFGAKVALEPQNDGRYLLRYLVADPHTSSHEQ